MYPVVLGEERRRGIGHAGRLEPAISVEREDHPTERPRIKLTEVVPLLRQSWVGWRLFRCILQRGGGVQRKSGGRPVTAVAVAGEVGHCKPEGLGGVRPSSTHEVIRYLSSSIERLTRSLTSAGMGESTISPSSMSCEMRVRYWSLRCANASANSTGPNGSRCVVSTSCPASVRASQTVLVAIVSGHQRVAGERCRHQRCAGLGGRSNSTASWSTKHHTHSSPGSYDWISGCDVAAK
jgi:hypothetical protein